MPSPVVVWSKKTMWPDCSPPKLYPFFASSSTTYLSPTSVLTTRPPIFSMATSKAALLIMVETTVFLLSLPSLMRALAHMAIMRSPSMILPFSSTSTHLSPSPSSAMPMSAPARFTYPEGLAALLGRGHGHFIVVSEDEFFYLQFKRVGKLEPVPRKKLCPVILILVMRGRNNDPR